MKIFLHRSIFIFVGLYCVAFSVSRAQVAVDNGVKEIPAFNKTALCPTGWVLAQKASGKYQSPSKPICLRVESALVTWDIAKARCRHGNAFLSKMDSEIMVEDVRLADYLQTKGFDTIWTGMHHDHGSLVWDELRPHLVKIYTGASRGFGRSKQGWNFDLDSFTEGNDTCGSLELSSDSGSSSKEIDPPGLRQKRAAPSPTAQSLGNTETTKKQTGGDGEDTKLDVFKDFLQNQGFKEHDVDMIADPTNIPDKKTVKTSETEKGMTTPSTTTTTDNSQLEDDDYVAKIAKRSTAKQMGITPATTDTNSTTATTITNNGSTPAMGFQVSQNDAVSSSTVTPKIITADRSGQGTSLPASTDPLTTTSSPPQSTAVAMDNLMSKLLQAGLGDIHADPTMASTDQMFAPMFGAGDPSSPGPLPSESRSSGLDSNDYLKTLLARATGTTQSSTQRIAGIVPQMLNPVHFTSSPNEQNITIPNENIIDKIPSTPIFDSLSTAPSVTLPTFPSFGTTVKTNEQSTKAPSGISDQTLNSIFDVDPLRDKNKQPISASGGGVDSSLNSALGSIENSGSQSSNGLDQNSDSSSGKKSTSSPNDTGGKDGSQYVTKSTSSIPNPSSTTIASTIEESKTGNEQKVDSKEMGYNTSTPIPDSAELDSSSSSSNDSAEIDLKTSSSFNESAEVDLITSPSFNDSAEIDTDGISLDEGQSLDSGQPIEVSSKETVHERQSMNMSTPGPVKLNDPFNPDPDTTDNGDDFLKDFSELTGSDSPELLDIASVGPSNSTELPPSANSSEELSSGGDSKKDNSQNKEANSSSNESSDTGSFSGEVFDLLSLGNSARRGLSSEMKLEECSKSYPYVCMSEAIEELSLVGHCDKNWYGHRLLDRCYKPVGFTLTEIEARQRCLRYSGNLATADTEFYGNVTAMLLHQFSTDRGFGKRAWVDATLNLNVPVDNTCSALEGGQVVKEKCDTRLPFICEKRALSSGDHLEDINNGEDTVTFVRNMTSFHPQTLWCPLRMSSFDDVVVWYKDGRPIIETEDDESTSFGQTNGQMPNRLDLDLSILERSGEGQGRIPKPALLQGQYWCEIWRRQPFHRVISHKIFLKFTDVITLHGTIRAKPVDPVTAAMFNRLGELRGQPEVIERHLTIMNKNITHFLRSRLPIVRDVISTVKRTDPETGNTELLTYMCLATGDLTAHMRGTLVDLYLSTFREAIHMRGRDLRRDWKLRGPLNKAITVTMTERCPEAVLQDKTTGFSATFPSTLVNYHAVSMEKCNGVYSGAAWCVGDLATGAAWTRWQVSGNCYNKHSSDSDDDDSDSEEHGYGNWDDDDDEPNDNVLQGNGGFTVDKPNSALLELDEIEIEEANVEEVTDRLAEVLDDTEELTEADIETVAEVVHRIVAVERPPAKVSDKLIRSVDKVLDSPESHLKEAERRTGAPSRLIADLELFGEKARMGKDTHVRHVTPNVAMDLWDLQDPQEVVIGVGARQTPSWAAPLVAPRIVEITDKSWAEKNLPTFDVAIQLPEALVRNSIRYSDTALRLTMFIYRKTSLFQTYNPVANLGNSQINSAIISASLGGRHIRGLEDRVKVVFKPFKEAVEGQSRTRCVFWNDHSPGYAHWSEEGCVYNGTVNGRDVCLCDHLTNFAVLLDFYGDERPVSGAHDTALTVLTLIGISLSIFGLAVTIITFLAFKKLRQGRAQQTLFNMAVALLCFQTIFLVGVKQTSVKAVCLTVAALLHYFILVSFAWMLIEAVLQYLTFVKVLGTYISRYTLKTVLPAWGLPLIPVIAVLATDYNLYLGRQSYCWMDLTAFYYAFALPVGVIVLFNLVMFFVILISLVTRPKGLRSTQNSNKARETNLKAAFTIFVLLGLTWLFGYLAIEDARLPFQYMFTILSSLQGFFIFVLMVVRRKQVRDHWQVMCCCLSKSRSGRQKKLTPQSSNFNSNSSNSRTLPSFINQTYNGESLVLEPQALRRQTSITV